MPAARGRIAAHDDRSDAIKYLPQTDRIANHALGLSRDIMEMSTT
jgi:hypothetical protein